MISIKFSHYYKNSRQIIRRLVGVENVNLEDLDPEFLRRDTEIAGGGSLIKIIQLENLNAYFAIQRSDFADSGVNHYFDTHPS